jgi:plastocyanin
VGDELRQVLAEFAPKGFGLALAVGLFAVFLAIGAFAFAYLGASTQVGSLQSEVSSLKSAQGRIPTNLPLVNQSVQSRNITIQWELFSVTQDRFFPDFFVVNQGDTIHVTFIDNDTGDSHTLTFAAIPTTGCPGTLCEYQANASAKGLNNFISHQKFTTGPLNCVEAGAATPCSQMVSGPKGNMTAHMQFTLTRPGIYRYFCFYHQSIGMFGFMVVLPNAGYKP